MLRISAGNYKGRRLGSPTWEETRPMSEKVRAAIFDVLGEDVLSARVLDLYAGTGAVGLEALSRGAAAVTFVDSNPRCTELIARNIESVRATEPTEIQRIPVERFIAAAKNHAARLQLGYDLVFFTPPYALFDPLLLLELLPLLNADATVVIEKATDLRAGWPAPQGLARWQAKIYGGTSVGYYVKV